MLYALVGRRGLGKTTLAMYLTRNLRPRIVFDPRALCPAPQGRAVEYAQIKSLFDLLESDDTGVHHRAEIVVTPDRETPAMFEYLCDEIKAYIQGGHAVSFIVDESTFVELNDNESFQWIIRQAPHKTNQIVLTQHRPYDINVKIRAIVDVWCVFRTVEPRDLDVIRERCGDGCADRVKKLEPREFVSWDDTRVDGNMSVHTDPAVWNVPLVDTFVAPTRVDLPPGNSPPENKLTLFTDEP